MAEPTVEVILLLLDAEGLTIADLEQARHGTPTTVAADLDEALAAMTPSTRERYAPFLRVLCDGLPEVCWCLCERCSGYVTSTCPCRKDCDCRTDPEIPVLVVPTDGAVGKGIDRGGGCRARLLGIGDVPLTAVKTGHLAVGQAWVRRRGQKRWVTANASRTRQSRPQHLRDGRSAEENFVSAVRAFFRTAVSDGHIKTSPAADLVKPKRRRTGNRALSENRLQELWDAIWNTGSDDPELDMLIIWTQLETGARRGGILSLTIDRVQAEQQTLKVVEKYGEWRQQPVSAELIRALMEHASKRGQTGDQPLPHGAPVLYYKPLRDKQGKPKPPRPLTARRFDTLYGRLRKHLPWADELFTRPHDLRKTAGALIERIAGHSVAKAFLGHAETDPTDLYVAASDTEVAAAFAALAGLDHHPCMDK